MIRSPGFCLHRRNQLTFTTGDATADVVSNSNVVRIPVSGRLLADIDIIPAVLTPNADGVNDELAIDVKLVNVLSLRP